MVIIDTPILHQYKYMRRMFPWYFPNSTLDNIYSFIVLGDPGITKYFECDGQCRDQTKFTLDGTQKFVDCHSQ